jgi:hypothetical protein
MIRSKPPATAPIRFVAIAALAVAPVVVMSADTAADHASRPAASQAARPAARPAAFAWTRRGLQPGDRPVAQDRADAGERRLRQRDDGLDRTSALRDQTARSRPASAASRCRTAWAGRACTTRRPSAGPI